MSVTSKVLCSLILLKLKTKEQTIQIENSTETSQNWDHNFARKSWVSLIGLWTNRLYSVALWTIVVQINFLFGLRCLLTPFLGRHATELSNDQRHDCHSTAALNCPTQQPRVGTNIGVSYMRGGGGGGAPKPPYYLRKPQTALSVTVCCPQKQTRWVSNQELPKQEKKATRRQDGKTNRVYQSTCTETAVNVQTTGGEIACRTPSEPIPSSFHPVNLG